MCSALGSLKPAGNRTKRTRDAMLERASQDKTASPPLSGSITTTQEVRLGYYSSYLAATADELRIYNRALSATEVTQLYDSTRPLP